MFQAFDSDKYSFLSEGKDSLIVLNATDYNELVAWIKMAIFNRFVEVKTQSRVVRIVSMSASCLESQVQ